MQPAGRLQQQAHGLGPQRGRAERLAVVTGAGRGFGEALACELSAAGWLVLAVVRQGGQAPVLDGLPGVQKVIHDVRSDDASAVVDAVQGRPVDVLINNAAQGAAHRPLGAVDAAGVLNAVDVNAAGPLRMVQALLPQLLAAADPGKLATGMGQADAEKPPRVAARELLELLESDERRSPSFVSLGAPDLDW